MKKQLLFDLSLIILIESLVACSTTKNISKKHLIPSEEKRVVKIEDSIKVVGQTVEEIKDTIYETGYASWYGPKYHGKRTASGEIFNQYALTAAHKTLPFNTMVKVVNKTNNKSVIVKINDRGPFVKGRIIDLSRKAAEKIDIIKKGFEMVDIFLIKNTDLNIEDKLEGK